MKLAIISDLHCSHSSSEKGATETNLFTDSMRFPYQEHPVEALIELINEINLTADYIFCPGDITNRIDKQGLITGYSFLKEITVKLNAKDLFVSVGNHDVDSYRTLTEFDSAYHVLRHFSRHYPYSNTHLPEWEELNRKFWAEGYYLFSNEDILVLNINTCFEHLNSIDVKSIKILRDTFNKIREELARVNYTGLKVALFHHHPTKMSNNNIRYKDFDVIDNGDALLNLLEANHFDLVVHGHKHIPVIQLKDSLPIFCSGSFSSTMNIKEVSGFNTFHIIELDKSSSVYSGQILTYYYSTQKGWFVLQDPYYFFPHITGYGRKKELTEIVSDLKVLIASKSFMEFQEVVKQCPDIKFLQPNDQARLEELLKIEKLAFNPKLPLGPDYLENYGNR